MDNYNSDSVILIANLLNLISLHLLLWILWAYYEYVDNLCNAADLFTTCCSVFIHFLFKITSLCVYYIFKNLKRWNGAKLVFVNILTIIIYYFFWDVAWKRLTLEHRTGWMGTCMLFFNLKLLPNEVIRFCCMHRYLNE